MGRKRQTTFEELMSVIAKELGLVRKTDIKKYIDVTLALQDGYPNDGNFDLSRTDRTAKSDYHIDLTIHELRKKIEMNDKGRAVLKELGTETFAIPVPGRGHRVFGLPATDEGYKWILSKINGGGSTERLG